MPIDKQAAIDAKLKGATCAEIAREQGVSRQSMHTFLKKFSTKRADLKAFQENKADLLDALQSKTLQIVSKTLESMERQDMDNLTPSQKAEWVRTGTTAAGILYDKARLERGQSTSNVQSLIVTARKKACAALEANA